MELGGQGASEWSFCHFALHFSWSGYAALFSIMFCFAFFDTIPFGGHSFARLDFFLLYKSLSSTSSLVWLDAHTLYS